MENVGGQLVWYGMFRDAIKGTIIWGMGCWFEIGTYIFTRLLEENLDAEVNG